jgi:hypothetical protein
MEDDEDPLVELVRTLNEYKSSGNSGVEWEAATAGINTSRKKPKEVHTKRLQMTRRERIIDILVEHDVLESLIQALELDTLKKETDADPKQNADSRGSEEASASATTTASTSQASSTQLPTQLAQSDLQSSTNTWPNVKGLYRLFPFLNVSGHSNKLLVKLSARVPVSVVPILRPGVPQWLELSNTKYQ